MNTFKWMVGAVTLLALVACGGGGGGVASGLPPAAGDEPAAVVHVPAAASNGVDVFAGWMKGMAGEAMEGRDAMDTSSFAPSVQDDTEPVVAP